MRGTGAELCLALLKLSFAQGIGLRTSSVAQHADEASALGLVICPYGQIEHQRQRRVHFTIHKIL